MKKKAEIDGLTQLYNRHTIQERIHSYLAQKPDNEYGLMIMADMDNFKLINDTYGHLAGDAALKKAAAEY